MEKPKFESLENECDRLGKCAFKIIGLVEDAGVAGHEFKEIRRRLLNLGNDITRIAKRNYADGGA